MSDPQKARRTGAGRSEQVVEPACSTRSSKRAGWRETPPPGSAARTWSRNSSPRCSKAR